MFILKDFQSRLPIVLFLMTLIIVPLTGCATIKSVDLEESEKRLGIGGSNKQQYHHLLENPYAVGLNSSGFIIGIEKAYRKKIVPERPDKSTVKNFYDEKRLKSWKDAAAQTKDTPAQIKAKDSHLKRIMNGPKSMFVSHILEYSVPVNAVGVNAVGVVTSPVYLGYDGSGFLQDLQDENKLPCPIDSTKKKGNEYENGWDALDCLSNILEKRLTNAKQPFTHLIIMSMGWNYNQEEAVNAYNTLIGNISASARAKDKDNEGDTTGKESFRPLVIGLTWPSVWGGKYYSNPANTVFHIASYPNKADDADEIGYGIANYLVNDIVPRLMEKRSDSLTTVLIGHSMGARLLSRAYHSEELLKSDAPENKKVLSVNLLGAFSARRYDSKQTTEGGPYSNFAMNEGETMIEGKTILIWSENDKLNPLARIITGAVHVGGKPGYKELQRQNNSENKGKIDFSVVKTGDYESFHETNDEIYWRGTCVDDKPNNNLLVIDAKPFVDSHSDIWDSQMGTFLWEAMECFNFTKKEQ